MKQSVVQLRKLIDERFKGSQTAFANATGRHRAQINQWLSGARNISQDTCRAIEQKLRLPYGWMDGKSITQLKGAPVEAIRDDVVWVRRVKIVLSAGEGFSLEEESEDRSLLFFRKDWLEDRKYYLDNLINVGVEGNSMTPTLSHGDTVMIDLGDSQPRDGRVYAINLDGELLIKRLSRDDGAWWMLSDNPDAVRYPKKKLDGDFVKILGRIVHKQSTEI